jgi:hypothetical protein
MSNLEAVLAQYEKNKQAASGNNNRVSQEERMKKYFTTILPKNDRSGEKRIRILPTTDGSSPFKEVYYHELQVGGNWVKLYDPKQDGLRSPLNEVHEGLMMTGVESDKELARQYRARKYYIVKVIDRDAEEDGVKFWRFKHNGKGEGILDKLIPIFRNKKDITDATNGRDLTISLALTKAGTGREYTTINTIIPEDISPLHENKATADAWINDELTWADVYAKKSEDYLLMVARGETPKWDSESKKWVSDSSNEETFGAADTTSATIDPQAGDDKDDDLPF